MPNNGGTAKRISKIGVNEKIIPYIGEMGKGISNIGEAGYA